MASSEGVIWPIITLNSECRDRIFRFSSFSSDFSVKDDKSKGLMRLGELKEKLMYSPPTASHKALYSFSGSITKISVPNIKLRRISNLMAYDLPAPAFAK